MVCALKVRKMVYESQRMLLFFGRQRKDNQKKLSAASDSVKVSGLAWSVLPEPANAEF
jgi:hypothetical protein